MAEQEAPDAVLQTIDLDCAPGWPRPGDLIAGVIKDTGLPEREPVSKVFGNWQWDYSDLEVDWAAVQAIIKPRIEALYHSGTIRYGSW
ncbi:MAG: hypothetical protein ACHQX3_00755 [Nitrospirales bacterium]